MNHAYKTYKTYKPNLFTMIALPGENFYLPTDKSESNHES